MNDLKVEMKQIIPVFRIFDLEKATEFYFNFLEFNLDWKHEFEEGMPLYIQISFGSCLIHLTEHHGDCSPGSAIRIEISHIEHYHQKLLSKKYKYATPGLEFTPWKTKEIRLGDPFGNRIIFYEKI